MTNERRSTTAEIPYAYGFYLTGQNAIGSSTKRRACQKKSAAIISKDIFPANLKATERLIKNQFGEAVRFTLLSQLR